MRGSLPIVAGVDGSESALEAVRWASEDAVRHRAPLRLVCAVSASMGMDDMVMSERVMTALDDQARQWLSEAAAAAAAASAGDVETVRMVRHGCPSQVLVEESRNAQRIAVGSRGLGEFTGLSFGSTAEFLVAHGKCPVSVVRGRVLLGDSGRGSPVVVGVDGSRIGESAITVAFEEASQRRVPLVAVHVFRDVTSDWFPVEAEVDWEPTEERERSVLAERLAGWQEDYPEVPVCRVVKPDRPVHCLIEQGKLAQLLVVGSRGRGGFTGMLLGSTSRALVHTAPCPVLVVRAPGVEG